jgi:hypothetical protein
MVKDGGDCKMEKKGDKFEKRDVDESERNV